MTAIEWAWNTRRPSAIHAFAVYPKSGVVQVAHCGARRHMLEPWTTYRHGGTSLHRCRRCLAIAKSHGEE